MHKWCIWCEADFLWFSIAAKGCVCNNNNNCSMLRNVNRRLQYIVRMWVKSKAKHLVPKYDLVLLLNKVHYTDWCKLLVPQNKDNDEINYSSQSTVTASQTSDGDYAVRHQCAKRVSSELGDTPALFIIDVYLCFPSILFYKTNGPTIYTRFFSKSS